MKLGKVLIVAALAAVGVGAALVLTKKGATTSSAAGSDSASAKAIYAAAHPEVFIDAVNLGGVGYSQPETGTPAAAFTGEDNNPAALGGWYSTPLTSAEEKAGGFTDFSTVYDSLANNASQPSITPQQNYAAKLKYYEGEASEGRLGVMENYGYMQFFKLLPSGKLNYSELQASFDTKSYTVFEPGASV